MTHARRGVTLIINNEEFANRPKRIRRGSPKDVEATEKIFSQLGFECRIERNQTKDVS